MHDAMLWCAFFGAWLLVAGPLFQAALELQEEDIERERLRATYRAVPKPPPVSPWWWCVPPVKYALERRRGKEVRRATFAALSPGDREALVSYTRKALAWLMVSGGGLLLAANETWLLVRGRDWATAWFWGLVVAMLALSIANVVARERRGATLLALAEEG